ncbi:UNVERIFIED_CONTAM: hypothetical protein K2H54_074094 [Gekko kuhli]
MAGYSANCKGYRILNLSIYEITISRSEYFDESEGSSAPKGARAEMDSKIVYPDVANIKEEETTDPDRILINAEASTDSPNDSYQEEGCEGKQMGKKKIEFT